MDSQVNPVVSSVRERLDKHPHFHGRTHQLQIEAMGGSIVVSGKVPPPTNSNNSCRRPLERFPMSRASTIAWM